jgi:nucleotide-binding universal stress UspA family protein
VTTTESPAASLKHHAEDAELVVVGNRGHGGFVGLLVGSVALQVAGHAPCPVVLVPPGVRGGTVGEIVVGVGGRATQEPLHAAFEEARLRDARLHVVHGWWSPPVYAPGAPVPPPLVDPGTDTERRAIEAQMNLIVGEWSSKYPTVPVTIEVINEPPRDVLHAAAQAADLVVVGTHDSGGRHLMALGSVAGSVVHHAQCPVLIAR